LKDLFNGNIKSISQHNRILADGKPIAYAYGYDQLHRIASMDAWKATATLSLWQTTAASVDYQERVSYDANGNITKYKRNKDAGVTQDSLNYKYNAGTNQLQYITDNVANNVSTTDIDGQLPNNYIYDKSGNMVADNSQSMSVSWSPYGKILQNNKGGGANLTFGYNAMQQRVLKRVVLAGDTTRTYYIRDAQGNTMGVYTRHNDSVSWREQYIFGSSRLGLYRADTLVNKGLTVISKLYEGKRNYELTNHLGNVLAVINDRKTDSLSGTTKVGFNAVVISATDYYPFGMAIDSRSFSLKTYRYGFNDKENDYETGEQDYGMRMYDPRIGKFLSIDPVSTKYPWLTPYQFASNKPISGVDLDGKEWAEPVVTQEDNGKTIIHLTMHQTAFPLSSQTREEAEKIMETAKEQFKETYSVDGGIVAFEVNLTYEIRPSIREMKQEARLRRLDYNQEQTKNEIYRELLDPNSFKMQLGETKMENGSYTGGSTATLGGKGGTQVNRTKINVRVDGKDRDIIDIARTITHEGGHSGGLEHMWEMLEKGPQLDIEQGKAPDKLVKTNIINSGANPNLENRYIEGSGVKATKATLGQMYQIYNSILKDLKNKKQ